MTDDVMKSIRSSRLSALQIFVIASCIFINAIDGFDVLAIAFTAPVISDAWNISPVALGVVFSSGLVGMVGGALVLGPIGDKIGRRPSIQLNLALMTLGMLATAFVATVPQMLVTRFITGLGIGGVLASTNTMVAEFASEKYKNLALSLMHAGYPVGGVVGGSLAAVMIGEYGWQSVFIAGAILSGATMLMIQLFLPESIDYLLLKRPADALARINATLRKMGRPAFESLPAPAEAPPEAENGRKKGSVILELLREYPSSTLLLWVSFFCIFLTAYFVLNWVPKIVVDAGFSLEEGVSVGVVINIGAMFGVPLLGFLSTMVGLRMLTRIYLVGGAISMTLFAFYSTNLPVLYAAMLASGFFLIGVISGCYSTSARLYPVETRNTGVGWAIGVGRFGAILGPSLAGVMIDYGWSTKATFIAFVIPLLVASLMMTLIRFDDPRTVKFRLPFGARS